MECGIVIKLSVNINKIATIRNSRGGNIPDLAEYSAIILDAGAHGITIHPRADERHITSADIPLVKKLLQKYNESAADFREFNIEGEPSPRFLDIVMKYVPEQVTLVPVRPGEITSDHGFDLDREGTELEKYISKIRSAGMRVSLFLEAGCRDLKIAREIGADRIELYTGPFALVHDESPGKAAELFQSYVETAREAVALGLEINAGHDLDEINLELFRTLPGLKEVSIGHRLLSSAMKNGLANVVRKYLAVLNKG